jgi:hypothetical protein
VVDIEFHRFSPYHNDPASFGIKLRPHHNYSFIYPMPEAQVAKLAYVFEVEGRTPMSLSYLAGLNKAIMGWIGGYRSARSTLTWERADDGAILVRDRRRDLPKADYLLSGFAAHVFLALDAPVTLTALAQDPDRFGARAALAAEGPGVTQRHPAAPDTGFRIVPAPAPQTEIGFTREAFQADPEACLAPMIEAGIVYREDGLLVSLPLAEDARDINGGWRQIGI